MNPVSLTRRSLLLAATMSAAARAMGRIPYGGKLRLSVPWPVQQLDPATLSDGFSALFSVAVFEPVYGLDASGVPYATLADGLPVKHGDGCRISLRDGLTTGAGRPIIGSDVIATLARARSRGAAGLLGELDPPTVDAKSPLSVVFPRSSADQVARALASPLLALVPRGFSPLAPDGCGPFKVSLAPGRALFTRNPNAARGPAFLDAIEVTEARDLAELLRGFEADQTDVGWFGSGLYRAVKEAVSFEAPRYAFAVLLAGKAAGAWGAPGNLQALLDAVPAQQLSHLGLRGLPAAATGVASWGGPSTSLLVQSGAPQLIAVARSLAASLSTPGHELSVLEKSAEELSSLRQSRAFGLLVDCVRAPSSAAREVELALRTAASPEAARRAPRTLATSPRELGRQLPLGVVGELALWGARRPGIVGLEAWQPGQLHFRVPR